MNLAFLLATAFAVAQDAPATAPDRTGEAKLRTILKNYAGLKNFHAVIWNGSRNLAGKPFLYNGSMEFWYGGGNKFRFDSVGHFGNGFRAISDGVKFMYDPLTDNERTRISVKKAAASIPEMESSFAFGRSTGSPLMSLMNGEKLFEKTIPASAFIKEIDGEDGLKGIIAGSEGAGVIAFYYNPKDPMMLVRRIEFDNRTTWKTQMEKDKATWLPFGDRLVRQNIFYTRVNGKLDAEIFAVKPPVGFPVTEEVTPVRIRTQDDDES